MTADYAYIKKFTQTPDSLIPLLQKTQEKQGYLPATALHKISQHLQIPLSRVYGVATFYSQFRFQPLGKYVIRICQGTACHVNGGTKIVQTFKEKLNLDDGETTPDGTITMERVACLGCCSLAPVMMINDTIYGNLTPQKTQKIIHSLQKGEL